MKVIVISYSLTGNNEAIAKNIVAEFGAEHIKVTEPKPRTTGTIMFDMIFNRTTKVTPMTDKVGDKDVVLFVGPVWMGMAASPFRAYFKRLKEGLGQYAYISISGGAINTNPKLGDDLLKRVGKKPTVIVDLHIADLLPPDPKPTMKDTSAYRLNDKEIKDLTNKIVKTLRETIIK